MRYYRWVCVGRAVLRQRLCATQDLAAGACTEVTHPAAFDEQIEEAMACFRNVMD